jgi:hypothetical protein
MKRLGRDIRARLGFAAGVVVSATGVSAVFGWGWALIVGGAVMAASFLTLYDVDKP